MNCGTPRCYPEVTGRKPADPDMTEPFSRRHDSAAFLSSESATVASPFASPAGIVPSESASIPALTISGCRAARAGRLRPRTVTAHLTAVRTFHVD
jgi:hypothetical protein